MASTCPIGRRCHVNGKGLKTWGAAFPWKMVQQASSSSVTLVTGGRRLASATLVWPNVVLCAAHSIDNLDTKSISIWLQHECDARTAQGGDSSKPADRKRDWAACTLLGDKPQGKAVELLESDTSLDYAFLRITWDDVVENSTGLQTVTFKRVLHIPNAGRELGKEVLLVGHPWDAKAQGEPAQASAGKITLARGPHHVSLTGAEYTYASFSAAPGTSGGGVFNTRGEIVGILLGSRTFDKESGAGGPAFLNLAAVASLDRVSGQGKPVPVSLRIRHWMGGAPPLMAGEEASLK